jgi:hypothetical protein
MSEQMKLIMQAGPQRMEDGRPTYDVRFLPDEESRAKIEGRHMPEIRMQIYLDQPNRYADRYVVEGSMIANIDDKEVSSSLMVVCACVAAAKLNADNGNGKNFLEQGFTADVMSGVDGLIDFTYDSPGTQDVRLVSTTKLATLSYALSAVGYEVEMPVGVMTKEKLASVFDPGQTVGEPKLYEASMKRVGMSVANTRYELQITKSLADKEADVLVLANYTVRNVLMDNVTYRLAVIDVLTVGFDVEPWSETELCMLAAHAFEGMGQREGYPLILAFSNTVMREYDSLQPLCVAGDTPQLEGVCIVSPTTLLEFVDHMTAKGLLVRPVELPGEHLQERVLH